MSPPHLTLLNKALVDVAAGRCRRLLVMMPPRHGKSELTSRYFPAWFLGRFPDKRVILSTYESDFASEWGRKARDVLLEHGPGVFGKQVRQTSKAADRWELVGHEGGMRTAGAGGPITGKGADLFVLDDLIKNAEEARSPTVRRKLWDWYLSTAFTRLEPGGAMVMVMTRWHKEDPPGIILDGGHAADPEPWRVIRLPALAEEDDPIGRQPGQALWPERYPVHVLKAHQQDLYWWAALYQQRPIAEGNAEWPESLFDDIWFDDWPETGFVKRVMAIDPSKGSTAEAKKGDWQAYIMIGLRREGTASMPRAVLYVDAVFRRDDADGMATESSRLADEFGPLDGLALEENFGFGMLANLIARVRSDQGKLPLPIKCVTSSIPKEHRIRRLGPRLHNREFRIRNTPGGRELVRQMKLFPFGDHDDGPDSLDIAVETLAHLMGMR